MMCEKTADRELRKEKVEKLKESILAEIGTTLQKQKKQITESISKNDYETLIKQSFALLKLREYIKCECTFYDTIYEDSEKIIYRVPYKCLEIWSQEDYSVVFNFLCLAEDCNYDIAPMLQDKFFGLQFTNLFDEIMWQDRKSNTEYKNETN